MAPAEYDFIIIIIIGGGGGSAGSALASRLSADLILGNTPLPPQHAEFYRHRPTD